MNSTQNQPSFNPRSTQNPKTPKPRDWEPIETRPKIVKLKMVDTVSGHKIPLVGELPLPEERVFENTVQEKPQRRKATIDVKFGDLTSKNFEQLRILNYLTLPVIYSENFYD